MSAAVLSIGSELSRGELVDTNAAWLSEQLVALGHTVREHACVPDEPEDIAAALKRLTERVQVVVCTGGLGPTSDDRTAEAVAQACGVPLVRDPEAYEHVRRRYQARGRALSDASASQANLPEGARMLPNQEGTAPGFEVKLGDARCFFMPGVPREMKAIFERTVRPSVAPLGQRDSHQVHLRTFGLPESVLAERVADLEERPGVTFGYRASFPEVELKVHAKADTDVEAHAIAEEVAAQCRQRLGHAVYGGRDDDFPSAVGAGLRHKRLTLGIAESCTGGLVGGMLTSVPGSSDFLLLDAVTYANSAKTQVLGVDPDILRAYGAVSGDCAAAMAAGVRRVAGSDLGVSITGIAGPGGGSEEKPVGTVWFGFAREGALATVQHRLPGDRERVRRRATFIALDMIRHATQGLDITSVSPSTRIRLGAG